jgi:hypothetical protein
MLRSMDDPVPDLQDRRLKSGKLKNWQRRYRGEVSERPFLLPRQSDSNGELVVFSAVQALTLKSGQRRFSETY